VPEISKSEIHVLNAAVGWLELGLTGDALKELDQLSAGAQEQPDVLEVRWLILADLSEWDRALEISTKLVQVASEQPSSWLHHAYAARRATDGGVLKAFNILASAASRFPKESTIPYNLACYTCQLQRGAAATMDWLERALDAGNAKDMLDMALNDSDLQPVRELVQRLAQKHARVVDTKGPKG
jgi:hypothetical protein